MATVGIRDVAERAGVSIGTVSNVLNRPDKVTAETASRVRAAISALGFVPNDAARRLREGRSRTIGLVVLDIGNPFFVDLALGAEDAAEAAGSSLLLAGSHHDPRRETRHLELFERQSVQGVLLSPVGPAPELLARLRAKGIPSVLVDRLDTGEGASSVSVDDVAGGRLAMDHLIQRGARRPAFVGGPVSLNQVADRQAGAERAAADAGVRMRTVPLDELTVAAGRAAGRALLEESTSDRPDALFAANDLVAVGLLQEVLLTGGLRVPDDVMIVGYDDIDFAEAAMVPLTSVRQPGQLIGRTAVELLLAAVAEPNQPGRSVRFRPSLVVRASTGG